MLLGGGRSYTAKLFTSSFYIRPTPSLRHSLIIFPRRTTSFPIASKSTKASRDAIDREDGKRAAESVKESAETAKDKTKATASGAAGRAEEVTEKAKEKSEEKAGEAKGKTKEAEESVKENTKEGGKRAAETAQSVGEKAKQSVDGVWEAAKGTTRKIKETVVGKGDIDDDDDGEDEVGDYGRNYGDMKSNETKKEAKGLDEKRKKAGEKMQDI